MIWTYLLIFFFFQAEDGIRDLVRSRGLGDVYKRQRENFANMQNKYDLVLLLNYTKNFISNLEKCHINICLLYTSDAADERSSVDLGGRRIIKKKNKINIIWRRVIQEKDRITKKIVVCN